MGVTLKACDLCGKKISAEEVEAGAVLAVKDKTFCSECKPKVIAKIKQQRAAAAAAAGDAPPKSAPGKPAAKAPGKAPGRVPGKAPARQAPSRKGPSTPPKVTARRGAPAPGSRSKAAAGKPVAGKPVAGKPTVGKAGAGKPVAGKPKLGTPGAKRPAPGGKSGARRAAPGGKSGATRPGRLAGAAVADGEEPTSFEIRRPSKAPLYIGISVVSVIVLAGLAYVLFGGNDPEEKPETTAATETAEPKKTAAEVRKEQAEAAFAKAKEFQQKNPKEYLEVAGSFRVVAERYADQPAGKEALKISEAVEKRHFEEARAAWAQIRGGAEELLSKGEFAAAETQVQELPKVLKTLPFQLNVDGDEYAGRTMENEIAAFRRTVAEEVAAYVVFEELERKAKRWASEGLAQIAELVVEEFDEQYEEKAPNVWRLKEESAAKIRQEGIAGFLASEREAAAKAAEAEAERLRQEALAREQRWLEKRDQVPWTNQLGRHNLYNWVINSDFFRFNESRWKIREVEGVGIMTGNNSDGNTMYIGTHTDRWQDYLLEFDVKLVSGSFEISPRTRAQMTRMGVAMANESDPIVLGEGFPTGTWVTISVEVHGDEVKWTRSDTNEVIEYTGEEKRLAAQGGFLFRLPSDSAVEIRKVRARIVSQVAPAAS